MVLISLGFGLIVGVILALTGAGGGILAVPLLVFGVGLGVADAGPIALLAVGMAAALGAGLGLKAGIVRYKAALLMAGILGCAKRTSDADSCCQHNNSVSFLQLSTLGVPLLSPDQFKSGIDARLVRADACGQRAASCLAKPDVSIHDTLHYPFITF